MRFLLAFDSYKGCLTSQQAAQAAAGPLLAAGHSVHTLVLSDGGEGWCEAWHALSGGTWHTVSVHDPLMRRIEARYLVTPHGTAYLESAAACGLHLLAPAERTPMKATSYGLGELIAHAVLGGARRLVVGLGGTATCDCGIGMLHALIHLFARGKQFADARATVLGHCRFIAATDVTAPLCGEHGATYTFAPQKGATPSMLPLLEERAARFSRLSAAHMGCNRACDAGAGAAGGLGYALILVVVGAFRELFGRGTLLGFTIIPKGVYDFGYVNNGMMTMPAMALILLGCVIWVHRAFFYKDK